MSKRAKAGISRRDFLRMSGGCAAMSQTALLSTLVNMSMTRSALAATQPQGYKAMVCLFLFGGNDAFNMLVPTDPEAYADYQMARGNLALSLSGLQGINDAADGRNYGLSGMPGVAQLYNSGRLSFVNNVGTLMEPTNKAQYKTGAQLPIGLFSHSDQQRHWQTSVPQSRTQITGWAGRMADYLNDSVNTNSAISMNIAVDSLNILQTGMGVVPYVVDDTRGAPTLAGYRGSWTPNRILTRATDAFLDQSYENLLKQSMARTQRGAIDAAVAYDEATQAITLNTVFPNTRLGHSLKQIACAIAAHGALGQSRQMFFAGTGGFDNHDGLLTVHPALLGDLDAALTAFNAAMVELGLQDEVLLYTASDFGRTLNSNGNGSDHAWGSNQIVMGGGLQGARMYGHYPDSLAPDNPLDIGRGRLIPTTSVDAFNAELAMWFGVPNNGTLVDILPNIRNFVDAAASAPLGFVL